MATKHHVKASINLNLLHPTKQAVRVTPAMEDAHDEMVASIRAHGLLQPLVVRAEGNEFYVVAGNRRYAALLALVNHGDLEPDAKINCTVLDNGDDTETALAENTVRVAMHPADQATAFVKLAATGATAEDIGNRFGLPKRTVQQRLRLGTLAPVIIDAYRNGEIDHATAQAYATTADTERQVVVFEGYRGDRWQPRAEQIVRKLQENRMRSDSELATFVSSKAYHDNGGASEATLFDDHSTFLDVELVERLAHEKLQRAADRLEAEGWKWVETYLDWQEGWDARNACRRIYPPPVEATPEEQEILNAANEWDARHEGMEWEDLPDDEKEEANRLSAQYDNVQQGMKDQRSFTDEQKAHAGVIVFLDHGGKKDTVEGLVRKGDLVPGETDPGSAATGRDDGAKKEKPKGYPQSVRDSVMELRNAVLRSEVRASPEIAQDILTFNMALSLLTGWHGAGAGYYPQLPLGVRRDTPNRLPVPGASDEVNTYLADPEWKPAFFDANKSMGEMFADYRALSDEEKATITCAVVSRMLLSKPTELGADGDVHSAIADELQTDYAARLLQVNPDLWSVETYWAKLRKDQIVAEATPYLGEDWATAASTMKKKDLAADAAERMRAHKHWLPKGFEPGEKGKS